MPTPDDSLRSGGSRGATSTSRSLLVRVRNNDDEAWDDLVTLYAPLVYYWCRKMQLGNQEIPDVVQEVFKAVAGGIERFRNDRPGDTFRGWLRTITRSKVLDYYRHDDQQAHGAGGTDAQHRMQQIAATDTEDTDDTQDDEEADQRRQLFNRALELIRADFQPRTWQAFWRVVVDGLSPKEVGEELEMQPGAVRVAKSRVLQRLRQELGELYE